MTVRAVFDLLGEIGLPRTLGALEIPEEAIPEMGGAAMEVTRPLMNNPRPVTLRVAEDIYRKAFEGEIPL